jgi:tight adherence protein B
MLTALIALGIFGTTLLLLHALATGYRLLAPRGSDRAVERLQQWMAPKGATTLDIVRKDTLSEIQWLDEFLKTTQRLRPFRKLHLQSDCQVPLGMIALAIPVLGIGTFALVSSVHAPVLIALLAAIALGALPPGYLFWLKTRRMATLERQLPEALELVSRALRAGHAMSVGLKIVGDESAAPIGQEFRRVFDEVSMGVSLPQALENLSERINTVDVRFFVTSVLVQRETGGNLAEIIDSLASLIRRRFELQLKVKALSAEGRFSAMILLGLPIVIGLVLYKMNPEYLGLLFTDPMGQRMATAGITMMVIGAVVMKRMVVIKV